MRILTAFVEKAPWFPAYLDKALPAALLEFAPYWEHPQEAVAKSDRLTVAHQERLGITKSAPDWDAWSGDSADSVPLTKKPVATGTTSLLSAMSEGLIFSVPREERGLGERKPLAVAQLKATLAALTRALAIIVLTQPHPITIGERTWSRNDPAELPEGRLEDLADEAVDLLHEIDDDMWLERALERDSLRGITIPAKSWLTQRLADLEKDEDAA